MHVQLHPTLCNPTDYSLLYTSVHGIFQASILEWVAISSFRGSSRPRDQTCISGVSCIAGRFFTAEPQGKPRKFWYSPIILNSFLQFSSFQSLSHVWLFATPWIVDNEAPLSIGFSRQVYWSGLPFPTPGDLPDPGIKPKSSELQADSLPSDPPGKPDCMLVQCLSKLLCLTNKFNWENDLLSI